MQAFLLVALLMQVDASVKRDTAKGVNISVTIGSENDSAGRRKPKRSPVTPEHMRTAFKSRLAQTLLERARAGRMAQDSALMSYDATAYLRISAGMGFSKIGRDRLIFRTENVTQVKWHRDVGAWIDVKGARTALPGIPSEGQKDAEADINSESDMTPVP